MRRSPSMDSTTIARLRAQVNDLESELTDVRKERDKFHEELSRKRTEVATLTSLSEAQASKVRDLERRLERIQRDTRKFSDETRETANPAEVETLIAVKQESTGEDSDIEIINAPPSQSEFKRPIQSPPPRKNGAKIVPETTATQDSGEGDSDVEIVDGPSVLASRPTAFSTSSDQPRYESPKQESASIPKKRWSQEEAGTFHGRHTKRVKVELMDEFPTPAPVVRKPSQSPKIDLSQSFKTPPIASHDDVPRPRAITPVESTTDVKAEPLPTTIVIEQEPCVFVNSPPTIHSEKTFDEAEDISTEDSHVYEAAAESMPNSPKLTHAPVKKHAPHDRLENPPHTAGSPTMFTTPSVQAQPKRNTRPLLMQRRMTGPGLISPQRASLAATTTPPPLSQSGAVPTPLPSRTASAPEVTASFAAATVQPGSRDLRRGQTASNEGVNSPSTCVFSAAQPTVVGDVVAAVAASDTLGHFPYSAGSCSSSRVPIISSVVADSLRPPIGTAITTRPAARQLSPTLGSSASAAVAETHNSFPTAGAGMPGLMSRQVPFAPKSAPSSAGLSSRNMFAACTTASAATQGAPAAAPTTPVSLNSNQRPGSTTLGERPKSTFSVLTSANLPPNATAEEIAEAIAASTAPAKYRFPFQRADPPEERISIAVLAAAGSSPRSPSRILKETASLEDLGVSTHAIWPQQRSIPPAPAIPSAPPAPPVVPEPPDEYKVSTFLRTRSRLAIEPPPQPPTFTTFPRDCIAEWYGGADARGVTFTRAKKNWPHLFLDRENCPAMPLEPGDPAIVVVSRAEYVQAVTVFLHDNKRWWRYGGEYTCVMRALALEDFRKLNKKFKRRFMKKFILDKRFRARSRLRAPADQEILYKPITKSEKLDTLRAIHDGEEGPLFVGFLQCIGYEHNFAADLDRRFRAFLINPPAEEGVEEEDDWGEDDEYWDEDDDEGEEDDEEW